MSDKVTAQEVIGLLDQATEERGREYVYLDNFAVCQNFVAQEDGSYAPACIAGQVYSLLDLNVGQTGQGTVVDSVRMIAQNTDREFTPDAALVLRAAQAVQDGGGTWGSANDAAWAVYSALRELGMSKEEESK